MDEVEDVLVLERADVDAVRVVDEDAEVIGWVVGSSAMDESMLLLLESTFMSMSKLFVDADTILFVLCYDVNFCLEKRLSQE